MARLFSYIVRYDVGFAPNPFHGWCSLACCKPDIRKKAEVKDLIVGTSSTKGGVPPKILYIMEVTKVLESFDDYWNDQRFINKRPNLRGSVKQCVGDNIYHKKNGKWIQEDSRHSNFDRTLNEDNLKTDTRVNKVLLSNNFVYWGNEAIDVPGHLQRGSPSEDIVHSGRGHKEACFSPSFIEHFEEWFQKLDERNIHGDPIEWGNNSKFIKAVLNK